MKWQKRKLKKINVPNLLIFFCNFGKFPQIMTAVVVAYASLPFDVFSWTWEN